jgi:hypothetical protein
MPVSSQTQFQSNYVGLVEVMVITGIDVVIVIKTSFDSSGLIN